jgi:hypothetical protein
VWATSENSSSTAAAGILVCARYFCVVRMLGVASCDQNAKE